jgi:hypothetical protein
MHDELEKALLERRQAPRELAPQLPLRPTSLIGRLRLDEVSDRLGLGEVDTAVEECTEGKFAGCCSASARSEHLAQDGLQYDRTSMTGELDDILARK